MSLIPNLLKRIGATAQKKLNEAVVAIVDGVSKRSHSE